MHFNGRTLYRKLYEAHTKELLYINKLLLQNVCPEVCTDIPPLVTETWLQGKHAVRCGNKPECYSWLDGLTSRSEPGIKTFPQENLYLLGHLKLIRKLFTFKKQI